MTQQKIELQDGRMLGYAEYGASEGVPVFYFHGFPGSRLDYLFFDDGEAASKANARIIAADRPGYGLSGSKRNRAILDWPDDVLALADALQIDRFGVLGISGGGPYAAACAFKIPERLTATGIVSGMGPPDAPGMKDGVSWTIPGKPSILRRLVLMLASMGLQRDPDQFLSRSKETFAETDRQLLDQPELAKALLQGLQEAFRSGIGGRIKTPRYTPTPGDSGCRTSLQKYTSGTEGRTTMSLSRWATTLPRPSPAATPGSPREKGTSPYLATGFGRS